MELGNLKKPSKHVPDSANGHPLFLIFFIALAVGAGGLMALISPILAPVSYTHLTLPTILLV